MSQGNSLYSYLKQIKMPFFFFTKTEQEGKTGAVSGGWYQCVCVCKDVRKGCRKENVFMYVNEKMRLLETIPGKGEGDRGDKFNYDIL
jgi:hypothetical protein